MSAKQSNCGKAIKGRAAHSPYGRCWNLSTTNLNTRDLHKYPYQLSPLRAHPSVISGFIIDYRLHIIYLCISKNVPGCFQSPYQTSMIQQWGKSSFLMRSLYLLESTFWPPNCEFIHGRKITLLHLHYAVCIRVMFINMESVLCFCLSFVPFKKQVLTSLLFNL